MCLAVVRQKNSQELKQDIKLQGFKGVDYSTGARDSGPVQFERQPEHDPFDLEKRVNEVRGKKNALDAIGSRGMYPLPPNP